MIKVIFRIKSILLRKNENHPENYERKIISNRFKINQGFSQETCHLKIPN